MSSPKTTKKSRSSRPRMVHRGYGHNSQFVTKKQMLGGKFTPPSNPPDVTYMPWHPITLVISHADTLSISPNDIKLYIRKQLDPTGRGFNQDDKGDKRFVIQFRLQTITSWNLTGRVISLSVDDFSDSVANSDGRDQLCGLVDTGTSMHTPAVGYRLPNSHFCHVLRTDDKQATDHIITVTAPTGSSCITYIKMLYRFDGPAKHPTIFGPDVEIRDTVVQMAKLMADEQKPSMVERIVDGVLLSAEVVSLLPASTSNCQCRRVAQETGSIASETCSAYEEFPMIDVSLERNSKCSNH